MQRLRINIYPADTGGCGRYRLIHAAMVLQEAGHDIHIMDPSKPMGISVHHNDDDEAIDVKAPEADVLVMQRITSKPHVQAIELLRQKGYTVVLDLDDDLSRIHPGNGAFHNLLPSQRSRMGWQWAAKAAEAVSLVTVSTSQLAKAYGRHGRCVILDNYIPRRYLTLHHVDTPRYGWPGSIESHPDDLLAVGNAAQRLEREGFPFHQVGPHQKEVDAQLGLASHEASGPVALKFWASTIAQLGVAWAPLTDTLFNASKSRLKILEANAVGVPYVASPRAEYTRMTAAGGGGLLATKPKDWFRQTLRLLTDHAFRQEIGQQGRAYASTQTIEEHAGMWLEAWELAFKLQHGIVHAVTHIDMAPSGGRVLTRKR